MNTCNHYLVTENTNFEHEFKQSIMSFPPKIPFFSLVDLYFKNYFQLLISYIEFCQQKFVIFLFSLSCKYVYYILNFASWPQSVKCLPSSLFQKKFADSWSETKDHEIFTNHFVNEPQTSCRSLSLFKDYLKQWKKRSY